MEKEIAIIEENKLVEYLDVMGLASKLTEKEKKSFLEIAKAYQLNPFKREIYCSKYGENLSIITGYEVYIKRAERTGMLDGWGVKTEGRVQDGSLKAIITIYRKDQKHPFIHEVFYSEYVQKTAAGMVTKFWQKAITMTKKVAMSQGFRLCFSDELGGMPYTKEEMPENTEDAVAVILEKVPIPLTEERFQKAISKIRQGDLSILEKANSDFILTEEQKNSLTEEHETILNIINTPKDGDTISK